jgi:CRP-like cAMP-binding protein
MNKTYKDDIIFSEGDDADELFFILDGTVKLYFDCSDLLPQTYIKLKKTSFNV